MFSSSAAENLPAISSVITSEDKELDFLPFPQDSFDDDRGSNSTVSDGAREQPTNYPATGDQQSQQGIEPEDCVAQHDELEGIAQEDGGEGVSTLHSISTEVHESQERGDTADISSDSGYISCNSDVQECVPSQRKPTTSPREHGASGTHPAHAGTTHLRDMLGLPPPVAKLKVRIPTLPFIHCRVVKPCT